MIKASYFFSSISLLFYYSQNCFKSRKQPQLLLCYYFEFQNYFSYFHPLKTEETIYQILSKLNKILLSMTIPNNRQPNIEPSLQDQNSIALNLFNTILQTTTNRAELECSWAAIERDISIQEQREARQR
jgi:hypothetical protein